MRDGISKSRRCRLKTNHMYKLEAGLQPKSIRED